MTNNRTFNVQRVQETTVNVDDYQITEGEDPKAVAIELAVDLGEWETVSLDAEASG